MSAWKQWVGGILLAVAAGIPTYSTLFSKSNGSGEMQEGQKGQFAIAASLSSLSSNFKDEAKKREKVMEKMVEGLQKAQEQKLPDTSKPVQEAKNEILATLKTANSEIATLKIERDSALVAKNKTEIEFKNFREEVESPFKQEEERQKLTKVRLASPVNKEVDKIVRYWDNDFKRWLSNVDSRHNLLMEEVQDEDRGKQLEGEYQRWKSQRLKIHKQKMDNLRSSLTNQIKARLEIED